MKSWLKKRFIRKRLRPPRSVPEQLKIKLATTDNELRDAYHVLYESYLDRGYQRASHVEQRLIKHFLPTATSTIIATWEGQVIGTLTVVQDAEIGVPLDKDFDLHFLRDEGRLICEISSLAIKKEFRKKHDILFFLFHYYYVYARQYLGLDAAVMTVNPKQKDFYSALFDFRTLNSRIVDKYSFVNGAPAVGLYHRFEELNSFLRTKAKPWGRFFLDLDFECHQFPRRQLMQGFDPSMNQSILNFFIGNSAKGSEPLTKQEQQRILQNYPRAHLLLKETVDARSKEVRFRTITNGFFNLDNVYFPFRILNLSKGGLMIKGDMDFILVGKPYKFFLRHEGNVVKAEIQFIWKDAKRKRAGGIVLGNSDAWQKLIAEFFKLFPADNKIAR